MSSSNGRSRAGRAKVIKVQGMFLRGEVWYYRFQEAGKRKTICLHTKDQDEAMRKLAEARSRPDLVEAGRWADLVRMYIDGQVRRQLLSEQYARSRKTSLLKAGVDMKLAHPREITLMMLQRWFDKLLYTRAPGTAVHYLQHIRVFLAWCVDNRIIRENVALDVEDEGAVGEERDVVVTSQVVAKLIKAARETDPIVETLILLAAEAGMRKGEIVQCRWEWFAQAGYVRVPKVQQVKEEEGGDVKKWRRKNKTRVAHVPLSKPLQEWLDRNQGMEKMGYVLESPITRETDHKWVYRYDPKKRISSFMLKMGYPEVTMHDLRRSFGSNRLAAGCSIEQVALWMGISPATAWKHYARWLPPSADINKGAAW